ncbi:MAG TPA: phosphatidylserine decarboxylase [Candidatus Binatia bacterium]|jgi:phosphatidylserine decarboxylase|nr:phosphatidylserine decarboxylase [Candidatus Binatia bacterium]
MKYSGKARRAAFKIILFTLIAGAVLWALVAVAALVSVVSFVALPLFLGVLWALFALFTLYFFRDPNPRVPLGASLVLSPAHGKVDVIDTTTEPLFMSGECQRVSIFLSVIDVHVQNAPVSGKLAFLKYTVGQFLNALKTESALHNENALLGFESTEPPGQKIGVRLIAGVIARRIVTFVKPGDQVTRGERISLIQFGSRSDVYLPLQAKIKVKLGDHVIGGQTVLAAFE